MTCQIIALGDSAKHWNGQGFSIGVNDSFKFGHNINWLVVINSPTRFKDEPDRRKIITESKPDKFFSNTPAWEKHFPDWQKLNLINFSYSHRQVKGRLWSSKTSPFVAICLAVQSGYTELVLWGIDMLTHKYYNPGTKAFNSEYKNYLKLFEKLNQEGVKIYRGADGGCFDNDLPIWKTINPIT